jgi:tetratricopeptide (TPR) repeat protein
MSAPMPRSHALNRPRALTLLAAALCVLASGPAVNARAENLQDIFRSGNDAFFQGDFKQARERYQRLVDAGVRDPDVYANLGLADAHAGHLGPAILSFERALRLRPGDGETEAALGIARAAVGKRRADKQGEALVETRPPLAEALVRPYREDTLAWLALVLDSLLFGLLIVRRRARTDSVRTGLAIAATIAGLGCAVGASALFIKRGGDREGEPAIVLREGAELREAPDPRASTRAHAHEGGSARVLARDGGFVRVRTAAGSQGWMASEDLGTVAD